MLALPAGFQTELEAVACRPVVVYELELAAATLRYSSQTLTWNGNAYTPLAIEQSPIVETMGTRVPECRVVFSNISNALRSQIEPVDLITNRRMTIRLLMRNSSNNLLAGSVVLMKGTMQEPNRVDQRSFEIKVWGLGRGIVGVVPRRNFGQWCQVHQFADGVDCNYVNSTTTNGSGTSATISVTSAQKFVDELARPGAGTVKVFVGADGNLTMTAASVGAQTITLSAAITFGLGESVGFEACDRTNPACIVRARTHEFQGFRGIDAANYQPLQRNSTRATAAYNTRPGAGLGPNTFMPWRGGAEELNDFRSTVPIIYGRRRAPGVMVERVLQAWNNSIAAKVLVKLLALSEGEIDSVVGYLVDDDPGVDSYRTVASVVYKVFGIYYRKGGLGLVDTETLAEYQADAVTQLRTQNGDYLSFIGDRLSRTAYATFVEDQPTVDRAESNGVLFDIKGVKIQKYTAAASPTTDGVVAWSQNPLWQGIDLLIARRYAMGREVAAADNDFTVTKPNADVCDVLVPGKVGTVTDHTTASKRYNVTDNSGFQIGMTVIYNGTNYTNETDEVTGFFQQTHVVLATARANWVAGDTITAQVLRYSSNIVIDRPSRADEPLSNILASCGGYITYSAEGKIQLRVEQTGASVAHFRDFGAAAGYGIIRDSFEWLSRDDRLDQSVNRVFVSYVDSEDNPGEAFALDHDHAETNTINPLEISLPNVNNEDQAYRIAKRQLDKRRTLTTGARFMAGPIGLALQPGDIVTVTHQVPNWTAEEKRVTRVERIGLGSPQDCLVVVTVEDYVAAIYSDAAPIRNPRPALTVPAVLLELESDTGGSVVLVWGVSNGAAPVSGFSIYKSTATFAGVADPSKRLDSGSRRRRISRTLNATPQRYVYTPGPAEYGQTLYFIVQAHLFTHGGIISNEVTALPSDLDPVSGENEPVAEQLVYDGDLAQPGVWSTTPPTYAANESPPSSAAVGTGYSSPANARDNNVATFAFGTVSYPATKAEAYNLTGGSTVYGRWLVHSAMSATSRNGSQTFAATFDGGTSYINFGVSNSTTPKDTSSSLVGGTKSNIKVKATVAANSGGDPQTGRLYEVYWQEITSSGAFSEIGGNLGTVRGDGGSVYGEIRRPFPGLNPIAGAFLISSGDSFITQLTIRAGIGSITAHHVFVSLYEATSNTYYDILDVDPLSATYPVTTAFQNFPMRWVAPVDISGNLEIVIRSIGSSGFDVDKLTCERGTMVRRFKPHADELDYQPDYTYGRPTGHNRGSWQTGVPKRSAVA